MVDLEGCEREPIRVPGAIQPHGLLLVLDAGSERVLAAAGDAAALLDFHEDPVDRLFSDLAGAPLLDLAREAGLSAGQEPLFLGSILPHHGVELDILAHERAGRVMVELEPSLQDRPSAARLLAKVRSGVAAIKTKQTLEAACETGAEVIRSLSGHDRVMVYQFMPDSAGKVIAESRTEAVGSFLNHYFPASDIPPQARELYVQNLIRVIPDVSYLPAPLVGLPAAELLDMSDCALRSVSPLHIQYMENMGVASSMSVSIIVGDALWGLVACHGTAPNLVPYEMREACKHIVAFLSQKIETLVASEQSAEANLLASRREGLLGSLARSESFEMVLRRQLHELMQYIPCTGVIVSSDGILTAAGTVPNLHQCRELCTFARDHDNSPPFATHDISSLMPASKAYTGLVSGVLAITVGAELPVQILWLRPEYAETIQWAGPPHKSGTAASAGNALLTPRSSFETWLETVGGRSEHWSLAQLAAAQRLRDGIERIQVRQRLSRLQAEVIHISRVSAMGTMASAIAHELNQPLTIVHNYVGALSRMLGQNENADPEVSDVLRRISEQSLRAGAIVRHLRQLVSGSSMTLASHNVRDLVESACSLGLLGLAQLGIQSAIRVADDLRVLADPVQIQQVLINLMKNSLEAIASTPNPGPQILTIEAQRVRNNFVEISVSDTGPGIPEAVQNRLFSAFNSSKDAGLGIGLSICRTIVEAHGGSIRAEAVPAGGANFRFTLQEAPEHG